MYKVKLSRSSCSAFPVSEEAFVDKISFFSLSCGPEWLRSSSEFLFLLAANPYYMRILSNKSRYAVIVPAASSRTKPSAYCQRHCVTSTLPDVLQLAPLRVA